MFLLLFFRATQTARWSRRAEVRGAITAAAWTTRAWAKSTGPAGAWPTEAAARAARSRAAKAAAATEAAGTGSAESTTWRTRRWSILAGACLTHRKAAAHERLRIEAFDDLFAHGPFREFDEREAARPAGFTVDRHDHVRWFSDGSKVTAEVGFCRAVRQVPDKQTN